MISQVELIERWENVPRVLDAMTEHERQKHWDMSVWGRITECGTVHCAAGRCGLDPWFRERGFKLDFDSSGEAHISDVRAFFGNEGSWEIFMDSTPRSVERVLGEVSTYARWLKEAAALEAKIGTPALGEVWPEQGGIYAGLMRGEGSSAPYVLIAGPELEERADWNTAMRWASRLTVDGFTDFSLPTRAQLRRLPDTVPHLFHPGWYWSCEQHSSDSHYAWGQDFRHGGQDYWNKGDDYWARAFRRLVIQ